LKKWVLVFLIIFIASCFTLVNAGENQFVKSIDFDNDGRKEDIYIGPDYIDAYGDCKKILVIKNGKNIFPEYFPNAYEFRKNINKNDDEFGNKIVFSNGSFAVGKFDNYVGMQILIFNEGYSYQIDNKNEKFWQDNKLKSANGRYPKRVFVDGYLFRFDKNQGQFIFSRQDKIDYTDNNIPNKREIIAMFKKKTKYSQAFDKACMILDLMKQRRTNEIRKLYKGRDIRNLDLESIDNGKKNVNKYYLETWQSRVDEYGYHFHDNKEYFYIGFYGNLDLKMIAIIM